MSERPWEARGKRRVLLHLDDDVATALAVEAAMTRQTQSAIAEAAIRRELERRRAERARQGQGGS